MLDAVPAVGMRPAREDPLVGVQHHVDGDVPVGVDAHLPMVAVRLLDRFVNLLLRHRLDAVVVRPALERRAHPHRAFRGGPVGAVLHPADAYPLVAESGVDACVAQMLVRTADHGVDAMPQRPCLAGVLVGGQPAAARPRVVNGGEPGRGHQPRDVRHSLAGARALLLLGELLALADVGEDVPGVLRDHAREPAVGVASEPPVGRIRRVAGDAGQCERGAVEPVGVPAAVRHVHRMVGHRRVEVGPVQRAVDDLRVVEHEAPHPPPGRRVEGLAPQRGLDLGHRPQVGVHAVELVHAARMGVGVDEPRRDGHAGGVDHLGLGAARLRMSSVLPTARKRSPRTANASARGSASSTV